LARTYTINDQEAESLVNRLFEGVTTEGISPIDEPYGHRIVREIVGKIDEICAKSGIAIREGVVVGVSPTEGLHAYQSEVPATGASIIDFAMPFLMFCNQVAILLARTLPHSESEAGQAVDCDPTRVSNVLSTEPALFGTWVMLLAHYAIEGWPLTLPSLPGDVERVRSRLDLLFSMELFAVAHEYGHHALMHGVAESSSPDGDATMMEHDADGFARMVSMAIGTNSERSNIFAMSGAGAVLMLGALDLVRRTRHVLEAGNTNFPPREIHPPLCERVTHIGSFDCFAPQELREKFAAMRLNFLGIVEALWTAVESVFLGMHHDGGVKLESREEARVDWFSLI
jgi:hypothetical protein